MRWHSGHDLLRQSQTRLVGLQKPLRLFGDYSDRAIVDLRRPRMFLQQLCRAELVKCPLITFDKSIVQEIVHSPVPLHSVPVLFKREVAPSSLIRDEA